MDSFYTAFAITMGILSPIIIVSDIGAIAILFRSLPIWLQEKLDEIKKLPPYDNVTITEDIKNRTYIVEFWKNNTCIWSGRHNFKS